MQHFSILGIHGTNDNGWSHRGTNAKHSHGNIMAKTKKNDNSIIANSTRTQGAKGCTCTAKKMETENALDCLNQLLELNIANFM